MTDIKLRPGCELAKAIERLEEAYHDLNRGHGKTVYSQCKQEYHVARAHLLEVIRDGLRTAIRGTWAGDNRDSLEIANEIMERG